MDFKSTSANCKANTLTEHKRSSPPSANSAATRPKPSHTAMVSRTSRSSTARVSTRLAAESGQTAPKRRWTRTISAAIVPAVTISLLGIRSLWHSAYILILAFARRKMEGHFNAIYTGMQADCPFPSYTPACGVYSTSSAVVITTASPASPSLLGAAPSFQTTEPGLSLSWAFPSSLPLPSTTPSSQIVELSTPLLTTVVAPSFSTITISTTVTGPFGPPSDHSHGSARVYYY
jgi:hypothetical protein